MSKTQKVPVAKEISLKIPDFYGEPSGYKFHDEITVLLPRKTKIMGYTYERGKYDQHELRLIVGVDNNIYSINPAVDISEENK